MTFILPQLWFSFFMLFSGQTLYDDYSLALFNVVFTGLPPLFMGIFEKDVSEKIIEKYPKVYTSLKNNKIYSLRTLFEWMSHGFYHSLIIYFGVHLIFGNGVIFNDGQNAGFWSFSVHMISASVVTVLLKAGLETKYWTGLTHFAVWGSMTVFFLWLMLDNAILYLSVDLEWVLFNSLRSARFYLSIIIIAVTALSVDFAEKYIRRTYYPDDWQILQEIDLGLDKNQFVLPDCFKLRNEEIELDSRKPSANV